MKDIETVEKEENEKEDDGIEEEELPKNKYNQTLPNFTAQSKISKIK